MKKVILRILGILLLLILLVALFVAGCRLFLILSTKDRIRTPEEAQDEKGSLLLRILIILMAVVWLIFALLYGILVGVIGYGSFANYSLGFTGIEFFTYASGGFFIIGTIALVMNIIRRALIKHNARVNNLVEKYKTIIYSIKRMESVQEVPENEEEDE